jgi:long-chain acyl-CoA synthetase
MCARTATGSGSLSVRTWPNSPRGPQNQDHPATHPEGLDVNLANNLLRSAELYPDRPAVRLDDTILTYADLAGASARAADLLRRRGVRAGDRVAVMLPNVPQFAVLYYGILRAGGVVVPMNPLLKAREVAYYLADSGARLVFSWTSCAEETSTGAERAGVECVTVDAGFGDLIAAPATTVGVEDRQDGDTAVILYTSGTTGEPKGAELSHANVAANVRICITDLFRLGSEDVILGALPLFHSFGQTCGLNAAISAASPWWRGSRRTPRCTHSAATG